MSYTDSLLASGEQIVLRSRQHWFVMVWNARWALVAILLAIALHHPAPADRRQWGDPRLPGLRDAALFLVGLVVIAWGWIRYQNEEFVVTSRRVIHVSGVVNKKASDSSLEMINDAVLTETVFGRMFGFGDLEVLTASESGIDDLLMLKNAKAFKKSMIEAKHELAIELERPTMPPIRATTGSEGRGVGRDGGATDQRWPGHHPAGLAGSHPDRRRASRRGGRAADGERRPARTGHIDRAGHATRDDARAGFQPRGG